MKQQSLSNESLHTATLRSKNSICRREVGDAALAEDVTQAVFLILAQKAESIRDDSMLA